VPIPGNFPRHRIIEPAATRLTLLDKQSIRRTSPGNCPESPVPVVTTLIDRGMNMTLGITRMMLTSVTIRNSRVFNARTDGIETISATEIRRPCNGSLFKSDSICVYKEGL
jgi:hypothetical protein